MGKLKLTLAICLIITISLVANAQDFEKMIREANEKLAGSGMAVFKVEILMRGSADNIGYLTVFVADRYLLLDSQWVPGDPRRYADGNNITYLIDPNYRYSSSGLDLEPINDTTFDTWENTIRNGKLNIVKRPYPSTNPNWVLWFFEYIGGPEPDPFQADIVTTGFLNIFPTGSDILGMTWTLIWVDGSGNPTDINRDGYLDTALKEIWYNNYWWDGGSSFGVDLETVVLHENGHGLGLDHFGMIFTNPSGWLFASPRAVMNAWYLSILRTPRRTDVGAINHIYNNWPR